LSVSAQTTKETSQLQEVVVTATRRSEPLQDVPLSVTAFSQEELTRKGVVGYEGLARDYKRRRDILCAGLVKAGFKCTPPEGAYYVMADFSALSQLPDDEFAKWMTIEHGVASVPGSSFYSRPELGRSQVRFAFCKTEDMLQQAVERLQRVRD